LYPRPQALFNPNRFFLHQTLIVLPLGQRPTKVPYFALRRKGNNAPDMSKPEYFAKMELSERSPYQPLESAKREFRLLRLVNSNPDQIQCEFTVCSLNDNDRLQ
jgi:hypothetical protein